MKTDTIQTALSPTQGAPLLDVQEGGLGGGGGGGEMSSSLFRVPGLFTHYSFSVICACVS